jgi:hypothetical protein
MRHFCRILPRTKGERLGSRSPAGWTPRFPATGIEPMTYLVEVFRSDDDEG